MTQDKFNILFAKAMLIIFGAIIAFCVPFFIGKTSFSNAYISSELLMFWGGMTYTWWANWVRKLI